MKIGDAVSYRSLAGPVYDATVTALRDRLVDLNVLCPGCTKPVALTRIEVDGARPGTASRKT